MASSDETSRVKLPSDCPREFTVKRQQRLGATRLGGDVAWCLLFTSSPGIALFARARHLAAGHFAVAGFLLSRAFLCPLSRGGGRGGRGEAGGNANRSTLTAPALPEIRPSARVGKVPKSRNTNRERFTPRNCRAKTATEPFSGDRERLFASELFLFSRVFIETSKNIYLYQSCDV